VRRAYQFSRKPQVNAYGREACPYVAAAGGRLKPQGFDKNFVVIGENIHATRVLLRPGKHVVTAPSGEEAICYISTTGETRYVVIQEEIKRRQDYQEGRVKHVAVAVRDAMSGVEPLAREGKEYLRTLAELQIKTGADFLDINVDEVSLRHKEQLAAMCWVVRFMEGLSSIPLSIDSSNVDTIRAGIEACEGKAGPPMLNSASLERLEALDLAKERNLPVIVTAAGDSGMPQDSEQRIANASRIIEAALAKGIPIESLYVDTLVFPISVDIQFGNHYLEATRQLRAKYGDKIHLTGGLSNVSFGLPCRRLVNEVFINLAVEAGVDSGIVDSVANDLNRIFIADKTSAPYQLTRDMLLGLDRNCKSFLRAYRKGELEPVVAR
jgi:5-methyltetrahydrofolate corrinoid/iron sulfur protein methyltransferase